MSYVEMAMTTGRIGINVFNRWPGSEVVNGCRLRGWMQMWVALLALLTVLSGWAQAASSLDQTLMRLSKELARSLPPVDGEVIRVDKGQLYLTLNQDADIKPGVYLTVYRQGESLKHPTSGAVLGRVEEDLGRAAIVQVAERYVVADVEASESTQPIQIGDKVRLTSGRLEVGLLPLVGPLPAGLTSVAFHDQVRQALDQTERFRSLAVDRAEVMLLDRGVAPEAGLGVADVQALSQALQTPYLVQPHTRLAKGQLAIELKLRTPALDDPVVVVSSVAQGGRSAVPSPASAAQPEPPVAVTPPVPVPVPVPTRPTVDEGKPAPEPETVARPSQHRSEQFSGLFREPLGRQPDSMTLNVTDQMVEIHRFAEQLIGLDVSDIDQDGTLEVVLLTDSRLSLYHLRGDQLELVDDFKASRQGTLISAQFLKLSDTSPLGIVVNHQLGEEGMDAFILSLQAGKLQYWQRHIYETLLAVDSDGDGLNDQVWGQAVDAEKFFSRSSVRQYRPGPQALERQKNMSTPYTFRATGAALARLQASEDRQLVFVDETRHLQIYQDREKIWQSPDSVGGSAGAATLPQHGELDFRSGDVLTQSFPFEPVPAAVDIDGDGRDEVFVIRNGAGLTKFVPNSTRLGAGDVAVLQAGPYGYALTPVSPKFDGMVSGLAVASSRQPSVVLAVTRSSGLLGNKKETIVFLSVLPTKS